MKQIYKIDLITFESETGGIYLFEYKINSLFKTMRVSREDLANYYIEKFRHYGITKTNVHDFLDKKDPKYKINETQIIKYIYDFHSY